MISRLAFPCEFKFDDGDAQGSIEGYASVFNVLDHGGDMMLPGAFKASLADWRKRKAAPPMLWQHDSTQPIGTWPEITEDDKGLKVKGSLVMDAPQAVVARALIKAGAVKGLSIGYRTIDEETDRQTGARRLKKVELWEISPVTFPMLPEAQISGVKSNFNPRELEDALREAGLSRAHSKIAVGEFLRKTRRDVGFGEPMQREAAVVLMSIRKAASAFA